MSHRIQSTGKILENIRYIAYPAGYVVYGVAGIAAAGGILPANMVLNTLPYACIAQGSISLAAELCDFIPGGDRWRDAYLLGWDAALIGSGVDAIVESGNTIDLSTLFFRLAIINLGYALYQLKELIQEWRSPGAASKDHKTGQLISRKFYLGHELLSTVSGFAMAGAFFALAYGYQEVGWGLVLSIGMLSALLYSEPKIISLFNKSKPDSKQEEEPLMDGNENDSSSPSASKR